jgi:flagellar protein FliL
MAEDTAAAAAVEAPKVGSPWLPIIVVIVLMPVISFALTQFVLIPKIQAGIAPAKEAAAAAAAGAKPAAASAGAAKAGADDKDGKVNASFSYQFDDVVVNLAGAAGTKYLKATFTVFSSNADLEKLMTDNKSHLLDVTLNVLSSKTLADLEAPGAKNLLRSDLIANFNQVLNSEVVEQLYFSEFVIQ